MTKIELAQTEDSILSFEISDEALVRRRQRHCRELYARCLHRPVRLPGLIDSRSRCDDRSSSILIQHTYPRGQRRGYKIFKSSAAVRPVSPAYGEASAGDGSGNLFSAATQDGARALPASRRFPPPHLPAKNAARQCRRWVDASQPHQFPF